MVTKPTLNVQKASYFPLIFIFHVCDNLGIQLIITLVFTFFELLLRKMKGAKNYSYPYFMRNEVYKIKEFKPNLKGRKWVSRKSTATPFIYYVTWPTCFQ